MSVPLVGRLIAAVAKAHVESPGSQSGPSPRFILLVLPCNEYPAIPMQSPQGDYRRAVLSTMLSFESFLWIHPPLGYPAEEGLNLAGFLLNRVVLQCRGYQQSALHRRNKADEGH